MVKYLIQVQQLSPDIATTSSGSRPIHVASKGGHVSVVDYLIKERKCDPTIVDFNEEDCLTLSIKEKQTELSNYLVNLGKFNLKNVKERSGFNYFAYAVVKGQFETATVMYE